MSNCTKNKKRSVLIKLVIIYILTIVTVMLGTIVTQRVKYEKKIEEINAIHEEEMVALREELQNDYDIRVDELTKYYEYGTDVDLIELEAEYIAKVIYGMARNHADSDKRAVIWCILNRVEHYSHPNTIAEVCEQPKQWMGYSNENPVIADDYELALNELKTWYNGGHRPLSNEYVYLTWSSKEIILRDTFAENRSTNYWRMK